MPTNKNIKKAILDIVNRLNDVRFVGQVIFVAVVLLISWSGVKVIQTNYGLQKQISVLNQQNHLQQLKNENLALQNQYYNSNQYLELSARENFGLATLGEKEVLVPQKIALKYTVNITTADQIANAQPSKQPTYQRNMESWVNFFLHRPDNY